MSPIRKLEKVQQAVVHFRELLDIMRDSLESGEFAYAELFSNCSEEDTETLEEVILQQQAAQEIMKNPSMFADAVAQLRQDSRDLAFAFEEIHDYVMSAG